jgi:hypothetical protein
MLCRSEDAFRIVDADDPICRRVQNEEWPLQVGYLFLLGMAPQILDERAPDRQGSPGELNLAFPMLLDGAERLPSWRST